MMSEPRVLLIDDDPEEIQSTLETLNAFPQPVIAIETASSLAEAFHKLDSDTFDAVLLDLGLPDSRGLESLHKTRLVAPELPIVVLTSNQVSDLPLRAMKSGAQDYLVKGTFDGLLLTRTIRYAIDRMKSLHALLESEERYWLLHDHVDVAVLEMDPDGRPTCANPAFLRMVEQPTLADLVSARREGVFCDPDELRACLSAADRGSRRPTTVRLKTAKNRPILASSSFHELRSRDGRLIGYQALLRAVTENQRHADPLSHERLEHGTDLINEQALDTLLGNMLGQTNLEITVAIYRIDIDQFKLVRDTCGTLAGGHLSKMVAAALRKQIRGSDPLARLSSSEFALMIPVTDESTAYDIAHRVQNAVGAMKLEWSSTVFDLSVSIGLVLARAGQASVEQIKAAADTACYVAWEQGGGRVYGGDISAAALSRKVREMQWVVRIKTAIKENRLCLYHQTIVRADDSEQNPQLFEVFVRAIGRDGRIYPAADFLPVLERHKSGSTIDRWVIEATLQWLQAHSVQLGSLLCAINISWQSISEPSAVDFIEQQLDATGLQGSRICFEVSEAAATRNLSATKQFVRTLRSRGCRFSLDDFGSGLSSVGHLRHFEMDYVKLDGQLIRTVCSDSVSRATIKSIAAIAHKMAIRSIAEHVDDPAAIPILRDLGVDYVQGYGIMMPEPIIGLVTKLTKLRQHDALQRVGT